MRETCQRRKKTYILIYIIVFIADYLKLTTEVICVLTVKTKLLSTNL